MTNDHNNKILITGATGLVGSHLAMVLVQQQKPVKALYRTTIPDTDWAKEIDWIQCDLFEINALEDALENVAYVYHCAGVVSFNPKRKKELYSINVEGTANIVNACINMGIKKLVHVSSVAALGKNTATEIDESLHRAEDVENSQYGNSKYLAEMEVWRGIGEGLQAVIVNPVIILGSGDWDKGSSELFKTAYKEFAWYTEGITGFVDVADVVKGMIMLMESEVNSERFIFSAENKTYKEVLTEMAKNFGKKPPYKKVTPLIASIVWRLAAVKSFLSGISPMLTKETSAKAMAVTRFNNKKFLQFFPGFNYTPIEKSIQRICKELTQIHGL